MTTKQTQPRSWKVSEFDPVVILDQDDNFIATTLPTEPCIGFQSDYDNAHLISAAPELLETLQEAIQQIAYLRGQLTLKKRRFVATRLNAFDELAFAVMDKATNKQTERTTT